MSFSNDMSRPPDKMSAIERAFCFSGSAPEAHPFSKKHLRQ